MPEKVAHFRNRCFLLVKRQKKVNRTKKAELRPKFRWENPILSFFFAEDKYGYKEAKIPSVNSTLKTALLKFIYSEKAMKFCKIFTLLLSNVVPVKSKVKISQNFVAFSEYMNFT